MFISFLNIEAANEALDIINSHYGFPDFKGTESWDVALKALNQNVWFIRAPKEEILANITYHEFLENINQYFPIQEK
ncbi:MAG: hypothetical protein MUC49_15550 [Raineya sp.]|jgi:hypothetical protein|nr:hypothetical protein [Raineya sp.]